MNNDMVECRFGVYLGAQQSHL